MTIWGFECEDCDRLSDKRMVADQPPLEEVPTCKCGRRMQPFEIANHSPAWHPYQTPPTEWYPQDQLLWEADVSGENAH